ncbi:MAG: sugar transferase, partial [Gemmatimonadota bacterium]
MHGPLDPAGNDPVEGPLHGLLAPGPWVGFARSTYLVTLDLAALILCATIAYFSWALPVHGQAAELYVRLVPLLGLFVLGYALFGLYPGLGLGGVELLRRLTVVTLFCFFFLAAASFALKLPHVYSRMTYAIAVSASVVVLPFFRYAGLNRARRWQWWPKPVVLIAGPEERSRVSAVASSGGYDYRVVGILHPKGAEWPEESTAGPVLGSLDVAPQVTERGISIAVVVAERAPGRELLDELRRHFRHVMIVRSYSEAAVERLQVRNLGRHLGIEYANNLLVPGNRFLKRALDLLGASIGLMITAPVMGLAMLLARISSPGPALFYQIRRGFRGRRFRMPKIRTM